MKDDKQDDNQPITRGEEALAFVALSGAVIPALFTGFCGAVGFFVWALEIISS